MITAAQSYSNPAVLGTMARAPAICMICLYDSRANLRECMHFSSRKEFAADMCMQQCIVLLFRVAVVAVFMLWQLMPG